MRTRRDFFLDILSYKSSVNIELKYKEESLLMKIIGKVLFFNTKFMTRYITTIGNVIYIPKEIAERTTDEYLLATLAHEYVHILDSENNKFYKFKYLFPQILAPLMLLFGFVSWWLALIMFLLMISPLIPAFWRKYYELRGYKMSLFALDQINKEQKISGDSRLIFLQEMAKFFNKQFVGSGYYFMWVFGVKKDLEKTIDKVISGDILKEGYQYNQVLDALINSLKK